MLDIIKMNKKQPFEAFKIPEDGVVNLFAISNWLGGSGINMGDIKPGYYIIKDMHATMSRVYVVDEETLNRFYDIKEDVKERNLTGVSSWRYQEIPDEE